MLGSEEGHLGVGEKPQIKSPFSPPSLVAKLKTMKMGDCERKKTIDGFGTRAKEVVFGTEDPQPMVLDFGDMGLQDDEPWLRTFNSTSKVVFDQLCMVPDIRLHQRSKQQQTIGYGSLGAVNVADAEMLKFIDHLANELVIRAAGLASIIAEFAILVYPSKDQQWSFLTQTTNYISESQLRYVVIRHGLDFGIPQDLSAKVSFGEPFRKTLMDKIYGLRLSRLLPKFEKGQNPFKFFLLFPESEQQTSNFFAAWILASCSKSLIYDSRAEGSWDIFINRQNHEGLAVVLIHEKLAGSIDRLPSVARLIPYSGIVFWNVSDSTSRYPMFPSNSYEPESDLGKIKLTRLLPQGCAFLVTPSFLVAEPELSYDLLEWFLHKKFPTSTPGTWKLVCCYSFGDFMLDLANSKVLEKEAFEREHRDNPAKDSMLNEKKLGFLHCEMRYKIHALLIEWEAKRPLGDYDSASDFNDSHESPLVEAPKWIDPDDEENMVKWFASSWSIQKLDCYRKFGVIGTNANSAKRASRLKTIVQGEPVARSFKAFSMSTSSLAVQSPATQPTISAGKRKAMEIAAKFSKPDSTASSDVSIDIDSPVPSKHGIDINQREDVLTFIATTGSNSTDAKKYLARANNDLRSAVEIYNKEEVDRSVTELINEESHRHLPRLVIKDSDLQPNRSISNQGSLQLDSPQKIRSGIATESERPSKKGRWEDLTPMDVDVEDNDNDEGQRKKPAPMMVTKDFEATSVWYEKLQAEGSGWEHVTLCTEWAKAKSYLGLEKTGR
ncbi:hypothetical protein LZ554_002910 [Drepanopeziza brunnea f. sp. 'monogermtubi']|nr:hypothetical protein LZ554_002910 [Drepanopeziza brunnea f. sp. 'monogermtubi']